MKYIKSYENVNDIDISKEYFMETYIDKNYKVYEFIYDINKKGRSYFAKNVSITFRKIINVVDINTYKNSSLQFQKKEKLLTPEEFFIKNKEDCLNLYNSIIKYLKNYPESENDIKNRYLKLLDTLNNIDEISFYININKYK